MFQQNRLSTSSRLLALRLSTSALALALTGALVSPSFAADKVVTSGTTVGQQVLNPGDALAVNAGGTITDANFGVTDAAAGAVSIVNNGTIYSSAAPAIYTNLSTLNLKNTGIVDGQSAGVWAHDFGTIDNSGTMSGTAVGLYTTGLLDTLINSGTITGTSTAGIMAMTVERATNSGTITGGLDGFYVNTLQNLDNTGTISGLNSGITALASIGALSNSGTIEGDVGIQSNTIDSIDNAGTIYGQTTGIDAPIIGSLVNSGTLDAGDTTVRSITSIGSVTNTGTITSGGYFGIWANDIGSVFNSGTMSGHRAPIYADGTIGSVINTSTGTMTGADHAFSAYHIGSVTNSGLLESGEAAVFSHNEIGSVNNTTTGRIMSKYGILAWGDIGSVINAGTIVGEYGGVTADGTAIGSLVNTGRITTTDQSNGAAVFAGLLGSLVNTGHIDGGWGGVNIVGAIGSVVNTGTISAVNESLNAHSIGSLDNSGTISGGDHAVSATYIGSVRNSGTIVGFAHAIAPTVDLDSLINTGTITSGYETVTLGGTIASLTNSGLINSDKAGAVHAGQVSILQNSGTIRGSTYGIKAAGITSLTNSGMIRAADPTGNAIIETGAATDTLLTLNAGSVLIGHVDIHGGTNTLNVGNGLNLALTFDTSVPELIETNGAPYTIVGNTVYVADIAAFAAAGVATADLTNGIAGAVNGALDKGFDEKGVDGSGHYWLGGIGGFGYQPARNGGTATHDRFGGFALGADFGANDDQRLGFFVGGAKGIIEATASSNSADSFYAGLYGASQFEDFSLSGVLTAGYTHGSLSRTVANNTVVGGLETDTAGQDAFFIAPSITFTKPWVTDALTLQSSLTLNYTGVFSNGFAETGTAGALTMDGGSTHIVEVKALLKAPLKTITEQGIWTADLHAGLEGRGVAQSGVNGTFAATPVAFASNNSFTAGILAGGAAAFEFGGGASIFAGLDGTFRSDQSIGLTANAGIKATF